MGDRKQQVPMATFSILVLLWVLGMVCGYTFHGYIHILLLIAFPVLLVHMIHKRRPV
jgi:hypothetical protein